MKSPSYSILLHYSEIALKLKNRSHFEKIFIQNIKLHMLGLEYSRIELYAARVFIHDIKQDLWDEYKKRLYREMLGRVFTQMNSDGAFINMGYIYNYNEGNDPNDPFSNIDRATFKGCALWVTNTNILDPFVPDISIRYNKDLWPKK